MLYAAFARAFLPLSPVEEKPDPEAALLNLRKMIDYVRTVRFVGPENCPWRILVSSAHKELLEHCYHALTEEERSLVAAWKLLPPLEN